MTLFYTLLNCNCEIKLLKLKANYNIYEERSKPSKNCNCEIKLLKLKANYNCRATDGR